MLEEEGVDGVGLEMGSSERSNERTLGCERDQLCWRKEERGLLPCNGDRRHRI